MIFQPPEFPTTDAFQFKFDHFGKAYLDRDWICPSFNFAVALAHASMAMGRKFCIKEQGVHYPNFYQIILGRSHLAAKSPTLDRAIAGVNYLHRNIDPPEMFNIVSSINSVEGFRETFETHEKGDPNSPHRWYYDDNGVRAFVPFDEVAMLLSKSRNKSTEGIPVELTRLYNPSNTPIENNTRQNKTYGENWVVNVFGCSTLSWYERYITQGDFSSGFLNRFVFYLHEQQPVKARFEKIDFKELGIWQAWLEVVAKWSLEIRKPIVYEFDDLAFKEFEQWYNDIYAFLIADPEDIKREASARIVSQVLKLSLVYSVFSNKDGDHEIHAPAFRAAQKVGKYWGEVMGMTLDEIDFDRQSKSERKVMKTVEKIIEKHGDCTRRMVRHAISTKLMSTDELNKTIEALVNGRQLYFVEQGRKHILALPDDESVDENDQV